MAGGKFSWSEAVSFGWDKMKANFKLFVGLLIVAGLISFVPDFISEANKKAAPLLSNMIAFIGFGLDVWIGIGLLKIAINLNQEKPVKFSDLFSGWPLFFNYLLGSILYGLIILVGFILLIVPGIILMIKFYFFGYFIVDQGCGPIEALRRSYDITTGVKWDLFVFMALLGLINFAGALALLIGLFATIPTTMVATAFVYRKLRGTAELAAQAAPSA